jgi:hypothetical protein
LVCDDLDGDIAAPVVSGSHKILALLFHRRVEAGLWNPPRSNGRFDGVSADTYCTGFMTW